jgi:predicted nucleotidyltransferase
MDRLPLSRDSLAAFCTRHRVRRLALFGSELTGSAGPDSDVDLLVDFDASATPSLLDLAAMESELSAMLGGRRVDLRTAAELSRYFRERIVREAKVQYVAG